MTQYESLSQSLSQSQHIPLTQPKTQSQYLNQCLTQKKTQSLSQSLSPPQYTPFTQPKTQSQYLNQKKTQNESLLRSQHAPFSQPKTQEDEPIDNQYLSPQSSQGDSQQPPTLESHSYLDPLPLSQPKTQFLKKKNNNIRDYSSKVITSDEFLEALHNLPPFREPTSKQKLSHIYFNTPLRTQPSQ